MKKLGFRSNWTHILFVGLLVAPSALASTEPINDSTPYSSGSWFNGTAALYSARLTGTSGWSGFEDISPTGDVDYLVLTCDGLRKVNSVNITYVQSSGDIDIQAYGLDGTYLGISQGVSGTESINVSSLNKQAIVLKVYGYAGSTNSYILQVSC